MVAKTPPKQQRKMVAAPPPISPTLLRETVKKVDKCMARLQELQHAVTGGTKLSLSPRSGRNYLKASLRCKHESLRLKTPNSRRSPGKLPITKDEWRKMSLSAMLLGETVGEILQATQFARNIVEAAATQKPPNEDPKTPITKQKPSPQNSGLLLLAQRRKEREVVMQAKRSESSQIRRARSKINFKVSPPQNKECERGENCRYIANRVSPRNRPWVKKTVLFPNPLFHSSSSPTKEREVVARKRQTANPHRFLIKSPPKLKIRSHPICISPTRASKKSPVRASSAAARLRRSFSPSRLASKLVSPLKSRRLSMQKSIEGMKMMSGLKQRPTSLRRV